MIFRKFITWGMTSIFMVNLILYAIPLSIYDVIYDGIPAPEVTQVSTFIQ